MIKKELEHALSYVNDVRLNEEQELLKYSF